jgi:hypothetical protein
MVECFLGSHSYAAVGCDRICVLIGLHFGHGGTTLVTLLACYSLVLQAVDREASGKVTVAEFGHALRQADVQVRSGHHGYQYGRSSGSSLAGG